MCGRYVLTGGRDVPLSRFGIEDFGETFDEKPRELGRRGFVPRYNIAPTQQVPVVTNEQLRRLRMARWGLLPSWVQDPKTFSVLLNARAETAAQKPSFRDAFRQRRCLLPASGFYEWQKVDRRKVPHFIRLAGQDLFAFAGLWEEWVSKDDGQVLTSCAILTTSANELMGRLHDRMPVILPESRYDAWLDPQPRADLSDLLRPYASEAMEMFEVGSRVNNARNDGPECIAPAFRAARNP